MNKFFKITTLSATVLGALLTGNPVLADSPAAQSATVHGVTVEQGKIYSEAHRLSIGKHMQKVRYDNHGIEMAANLYFPENFDKSKKYPVIVVGHPGGGVKEQAAGLYAKLLAEKGFITIAFDASHQGESGGLPRHLEDPDKRTGDYTATVDYLTTLPYVDNEKIAMLGICAGGGYATAATLRDPRVKALTTVSAYHVSNRNWDGSEISAADKRAFLQNVAAQRTAEANGAELKTIDVLEKPNAGTPRDLAQAYDYYLTERGYYPTAQNKFLFSGMGKFMYVDRIAGIEELLTQPLLVIAGDEAGSRWQSDLIFERAKSAKDKEFMLIKGATHMTMYDNLDHIHQALDKAVPFFKKHLQVK